MNLLKKITAIIVSTMLLMTSGDISVFAESGEKNISERIIVGEEEIRNYLKANGNSISGQISTTLKDYIINYQDMQGIGMTVLSED